MLIEVIDVWRSDVCPLFDYLVDIMELDGWLSRGLVVAYMSWRSETERLRRVEYVKDANGQTVEREVMQSWYDKYYPHGIGFGKDRNPRGDAEPSGFSEFSRLLDEHPV